MAGTEEETSNEKSGVNCRDCGTPVPILVQQTRLSSWEALIRTIAAVLSGLASLVYLWSKFHAF